MKRIVWTLCTILLALGAASALPTMRAHAAPAPKKNVTCTASMTDVVFGAVNPLSSQTPANATLSYTCTNNAHGKNGTRYATVCFSIGDGAQGAGQTNPRQMQDGAGDVLQFQLFQDAGYNTVWGSQFFGAFLTPLMVNVTIPAAQGPLSGSVSGTATLHGQVAGGQTTAIPSGPLNGSYQDQFTGGHTAITVNASAVAAPGTCDTAIAGTFPFTVTAAVSKQCAITASTLDFGTVGLLNSIKQNTSTLNVQCSNTTPYNVGLDGGTWGNISLRKMQLGTTSGDFVDYQLYRDSNRTQVWGDTVNTDTVAGTGDGNSHTLSVYGQVPVQTTPPAGIYQDTVVVSVTY